jgi:hypothetical protein
LPTLAQVPQFTVTTVGRDIQVAGARVGAAYAVLDMQGRVMGEGRVESANFNLTVSRAGTYIIKIGYTSRVVPVR